MPNLIFRAKRFSHCGSYPALVIKSELSASRERPDNLFKTVLRQLIRPQVVDDGVTFILRRLPPVKRQKQQLNAFFM
jgi:hypothetical protein